MTSDPVRQAEGNRDLASWLITHRKPIDAAVAERLGPAAPSPGTPEAEALRRFRSFACAALVREKVSAPALDGVRVNERRLFALLEAWRDCALALAPPHTDQQERLAQALRPLLEHFRVAIRATGHSRTKRGKPRATRRAVSAAIDRVAEAFLAIDADTGLIVDANPAAGSLLGVQRDALLGIEAFSFIPQGDHAHWWEQLDAVCESEDPRLLRARVQDRSGVVAGVEASVTRFATRDRTLALVMMRPEVGASATVELGPPAAPLARDTPATPRT